jgi:hypothetical protein
LGCHVQPLLNRLYFFEWNGKLWAIFAYAPNNFLLQPMAQGLHLLTLWLMQDDAWPHTVNNVLHLFNAVFVPSIMSNWYLDHHNCDVFGHLPDLIWILVTSFCAVSCKRRCCHKNHTMKLWWKLCLLSCAQGLMKTYHGVNMNLCINFKNVLKEMVATWAYSHTQKIYTDAWIMCRKVVEERETVHFL